MSIEVDEGYGSVHPVHRPRQRDGNGVVAAQRHQLGAVVEQRIGTPLDGSHCLVNVERVTTDVAGIDYLLGGERFGVEVRVILPQQLGAHPDRLGAKPRPRPV